MTKRLISFILVFIMLLGIMISTASCVALEEFIGYENLGDEYLDKYYPDREQADGGDDKDDDTTNPNPTPDPTPDPDDGKDDVVTINDFNIGELSQRLYDTLTGIQWGKIEDTFGWTYKL